MSTPYYTPPPTPRPRLEELPPHEAMIYIAQLRARLSAKRSRERAYLDRRAARGAHTPTDEAYEADQVLEYELLDLLQQVEESARALAAEEGE